MITKVMGIVLLCTVFIIGLSVSGVLAITKAIETDFSIEDNTDQQGTPLEEAQTFKITPGLIDTLKTFSNEYYKILKEFEKEATTIVQKLLYDLLASRNAINLYKTNLNQCSIKDYSIQECNMQEETMQACEQRLLTSCLGSTSKVVASKHTDLNADLIQLRQLTEQWDTLCNQIKSLDADFNILGTISCKE
jgi:hypothetical protein